MMDYKPRGWLRLLGASLLIAIVWLWLLPLSTKQPPIERHLNWLRENRIDPSAMFYTELETFGGDSEP